MLRARGARVVRDLGLVVLANALTVVACASLVGVEDVKLRKADAANPDLTDPDVIDEDVAVIGDGGGPPTGPNVLEVALGLQHTCARTPAGVVKCWGDNNHDQCGPADGDGGLLLTPQPVGISDARHVAAGQYHTCAVRSSGKVSCWGENTDGQIGNGNTSGARVAVPADVKGINDAVGIACGASFSCALRSSGSVACWGNGLGGQLGNGGKQLQYAPVAVAGLTNAVAISAGESHACAVRNDGKVVCWGDNVNGQLGTGDQLERTTPAVTISLDGMAIVAAAARSTCAAKTTGGVFCWGANEVGQLGSGAANPTPNPSPTAVSGLDAIALWAGSAHACAVRRGGTVACWGAGYQGQIGDGQPRASSSTPTPAPAAVSGITNAIGVGTGGNHSCAPTATGAILCWGDNKLGEIGNGEAGNQLLSPESVVGYP